MNDDETSPSFTECNSVGEGCVEGLQSLHLVLSVMLITSLPSKKRFVLRINSINSYYKDNRIICIYNQQGAFNSGNFRRQAFIFESNCMANKLDICTHAWALFNHRFNIFSLSLFFTPSNYNNFFHYYNQVKFASNGKVRIHI